MIKVKTVPATVEYVVYCDFAGCERSRATSDEDTAPLSWCRVYFNCGGLRDATPVDLCSLHLGDSKLWVRGE